MRSLVVAAGAGAGTLAVTLDTAAVAAAVAAIVASNLVIEISPVENLKRSVTQQLCSKLTLSVECSRFSRPKPFLHSSLEGIPDHFLTLQSKSS